MSLPSHTLGAMQKSKSLMREQLIRHICDRLRGEKAGLREQFDRSRREVGVRYAYLDDLLPDSIASDIYKCFPSTEAMRLMDSFRERKYTSKSFDQFHPLLFDITFAVQDSRVVKEVEKITGIGNQIPDARLYAGGLSAMGRGHFLAPHIDNSHDGERKHYRTLNLLYYVTPDWALEFGGNLELWDRRVMRNTTIASIFNRLVIMETSPWSWHSVSPVKVDRLRCCVSNYYFSPASPTGQEYFNVTSFSARPEQKARRALAWADNKLRHCVRWFAPSGLGKTDIYQGPAK